VQSFILPNVELADNDIAFFKYFHKRQWAEQWGKDEEDFLLQVKFDIPVEHWPNLLEWWYSNLPMLYDLGYEAGMRFLEEYQERLKVTPAGRVSGAGRKSDVERVAAAHRVNPST